MGPTRKFGLVKTWLKKDQNPIIQQSPRSIKYQDFRNLKAIKDRDEEGLLHCQDYLVDLPRCGIARLSLDLHHTEGRNGDLLFDESKMVWLTRSCHERAHNNSSSTRTKTKNDPQRPLEATPQRNAILGLQGRPETRGNGQIGSKVHYSIQSGNAGLLERQKEKFV